MWALVTSVFPQAKLVHVILGAIGVVIAIAIGTTVYLAWNTYHDTLEQNTLLTQVVDSQAKLMQRQELMLQMDKALNAYDPQIIREAVAAAQIFDTKLQKDIAEIKRINRDAIATGCAIPPGLDYLLDSLRLNEGR